MFKTGVVNAAVVAIDVPPIATEYHANVEPADVAVNVVVFPAQIVVVQVIVGTVGIGFTVTVTGVLALVQPVKIAST